MESKFISLAGMEYFGPSLELKTIEKRIPPAKKRLNNFLRRQTKLPQGIRWSEQSGSSGRIQRKKETKINIYFLKA